MLLGDMDDIGVIKQVSPKELKARIHPTPTEAHIERQLIERESQIGARLFGQIPTGHRREFFCLDDTSWIWYEEWKDAAGKLQKSTIRYEIQPAGILKVQEGARYSYLEGEELNNFMSAIKAYHGQVLAQVYNPLLNAA